MAAPEEGPEPLKYQTLALKVSIHCEGCKRKVKKVLRSIEGVYKTSIDPQQHKVVVTGNVEAETLIKKLLKTRRHVELWPVEKPNADKSNNGGGGKKNKGKNKNDGKQNEQPEKPEEGQTPPAADESSADNCDKPGAEAPKNPAKEVSPPPEKPQEGDKPAGGAGGGGKKKNKKGNNNNSTPNQTANADNNTPNGNSSNSNTGGDGNGADVKVATHEDRKKTAAAGRGGDGGAIPASPFNVPLYSPPHLPSYMVSYSAVQPAMSYGGAYYMASTLRQGSYVYSPAAPGSYYIFSDENANACGIM